VNILELSAEVEDELVSVVMATFNGEKYIREQLDSILNQDYRHLEVIVVDDASTDSTQAILEEYSQLDKRISYVCAGKNAGASASFELALELAKGVFIAFSDQDDIFDGRKISVMVAALKANPSRDMVASDLSLIDAEGNIIADSMWQHQQLRVKEGKPFKQLLYMNFVTGCAMMIRRRLLKISLPFPAGCMVHDWWLAVVSCSGRGGGLALVKDPLTLYRQHGANSIGSHQVSLQSSIKRATNLESRNQWYQMNRKRLDGYLCRGDWNERDQSAIESARDAFEGLCMASESSVLARLGMMGKVLKMAKYESLKHRLGLALFTLYPMLVDHLARLRGRSG